MQLVRNLKDEHISQHITQVVHGLAYKIAKSLLASLARLSILRACPRIIESTPPPSSSVARHSTELAG